MTPKPTATEVLDEILQGHGNCPICKTDWFRGEPHQHEDGCIVGNYENAQQADRPASVFSREQIEKLSHWFRISGHTMTASLIERESIFRGFDPGSADGEISIGITGRALDDGSIEIGSAEIVAVEKPMRQADDLVTRIVDRFLSWKLPDTFNPDGHISFNKSPDARGNPITWPVGTNLFCADEARAMVEHIAGPEIEALRAERDAHKQRGDNHWETLRSIREIARTSGDLERIIQWVSDAGQGYTASAETTLSKEMDARKSAETRVAALEIAARKAVASIKEQRKIADEYADECGPQSAASVWKIQNSHFETYADELDQTIAAGGENGKS